MSHGTAKDIRKAMQYAAEQNVGILLTPEDIRKIEMEEPHYPPDMADYSVSHPLCFCSFVLRMEYVNGA